MIALSGALSSSRSNSKLENSTIISSSSSSSLIVDFGSVDWDENKASIGSFITSWKVGDTTWTDVGMIINVGGGGGSGGVTTEVLTADVKIPSPILTFEFVLDMFLVMFEVTQSSILDSKILSSVGVTWVFSRIEVGIDSPESMYGSILDVLPVTPWILISLKFNLSLVSFRVKCEMY